LALSIRKTREISQQEAPARAAGQGWSNRLRKYYHGTVEM
jgi:hypothetical protein